MIIAERKPLAEIQGFIAGAGSVLVLGCRGCVTVCNAGGTKEVGLLASLLRLGLEKEGRPGRVEEYTLERQCDPEYVEELAEVLDKGYDVVLSLACGVGPQFVAARYPGQKVYPGLNTLFMGGALRHGVWTERCQGCGNCLIHQFGGLCPIARCAKSLQHGPCGGSIGGQCEISKEVDCVWHLIVTKMMETGADNLPVQPLKDWSTSRDGGPRTIIREDLVK